MGDIIITILVLRMFIKILKRYSDAGTKAITNETGKI